MKADRDTETGVMELINNFLEAYARHDLEETLAFLAPDPDLFLFGTGIDERVIGIEEVRRQLKRDFEQSGDISIKLRNVTVSAAGSVAWVAAESNWKVKTAEHDATYDLRWTMVLEKREGRWLIVQSHLSAPAEAQAEGQSFPSQ